MHVYLAEQALQDALDNGKVTIDLLDPKTGQILGTIGEYEVDRAILQALRSFPGQYTAGVLGPDAFPDILTGQQVIHPPTNPEGSTRWLQYLWSKSRSCLALAMLRNTTAVTADNDWKKFSLCPIEVIR